MNNKSSLSLIGAIVFGSLIKNLKSKGSAGLLIRNPKDLEELEKTEIEVQFEFETDLDDEFTTLSNVIDDFPRELMKLSNDLSSTYTKLTMHDVIQDQQRWLLRFQDVLYCDFPDAGDIANAICNRIQRYPAELTLHMQVLHYLKSIEIIEKQWPQNPYSREIELTINITLKLCDEKTIEEIADTIGLLIRFLYFSDYHTGNVTIDPNNKLSETVKSLIFGRKKSELRRF